MLPIVNTSLVENMGIKLYSNNKSIDIYSCYFTGELVGTGGIQKQLFKLDIFKLSRVNNFILGGDFNSRHHSWGCVRANAWCNILFEKQLITMIYYIHYTIRIFRHKLKVKVQLLTYFNKHFSQSH